MPESIHLCLLITLLWGVSVIGNTSLAETEVNENTKKDKVILDNIKHGVQSVIKPIITGQESSEGLYFNKWGPANFRLSMLRGLEMTWDDSDFSMRLGGRAYIDLAFYVEDQNDLGDNGLGVRTILVEMNGKLNKNWSYRFSWGGFTSGGKVNTSGVELDDAFVRYLGFDNVILTAGQHTEPFSLEEQTSSLNMTFMERALPNAFAPGTTLGISASTGGNNWFATGGFFSEQITDTKDQGSQGYGFTGYLSTSPWRNDQKVIHIGSSFSYRAVGDENDIFFRNRPESGLSTVRYVNTDTIAGADVIGRFGFDIVGIFGPWSFQSEYIHTHLGRDTGYQDVDFSGGYAFLSWFPTGESRNYRKNGVFGVVTPEQPYGAWEIALRYSGIDLNDADIRGGEEHNITFGVNWYIHQQLRLMLNYIYVMTDAKANDNGDVLGNDNPHIIQMRFQANF
jgi:phosphate-selective porin OprO/OprP